MEDWNTIIGDNVKRRRKMHGLTQEKLAVNAEIDLACARGSPQSA